jgi:transcriptional regulator with XRE-family HTH domain
MHDAKTMEKNKIDFRAAVLAAMEKKGWTAYRLGQESGVAASDISRWLDAARADHQPHLTTKRLEPILSALGITLLTKREKRLSFNGDR